MATSALSTARACSTFVRLCSRSSFDAAFSTAAVMCGSDLEACVRRWDRISVTTSSVVALERGLAHRQTSLATVSRCTFRCMYDPARWGTMAEWFSAIGTVGAVVTTMILMRRQSRELVEVIASASDDVDGPVERVNVEVRNTGARAVRITSITLEIVRSGQRFGNNMVVRLPPMSISPSLPARLETGDHVVAVFDRQHIADIAAIFREKKKAIAGARVTFAARTALGAKFRGELPPADLPIRRARKKPTPQSPTTKDEPQA